MAQSGLKPKQKNVAEMLANPRCGMNDSEIIQACNVPRSTFYRWLREDEAFTAYVNSLVERYTDAELSAVWKALIIRCKMGDVQAIKLFFELKGRYSQQVTFNGGVPVQIIDNIPEEAAEDEAID